MVDAAIYESVLALTEGLVPEWAAGAPVRGRTGTSLAGIAPSNIYPTADGSVLVAANQDTVFLRLATAMGRAELAQDPRFADHRARGAHAEALDELVSGWTVGQRAQDVLAALHEVGVPCGLLYTPADMADDPHFQARQSLVEVTDPDAGPVLMPAVAPRLSRTPGSVRWTGPRLGEHTEQVLAEAGLSPDDVAGLRAAGVV